LLCPCKNEWISPILNIDIGEAIGLLKALNWIYELQLTNVDFELDSQIVVTRFHGKKEDVSELGDVINDCKRIYNSHFTNLRVEFIRR
jgi:ribonuclease HI